MVCMLEKNKKQKNIGSITMCLADFYVICHYLRFSIIKLISVAWIGLEREKEGVQISMQFYVFHLLIKTETERNWNVGSSTLHVFRFFHQEQTREKNFIWQLVCVLLRIKPEEWGLKKPLQSFLSDRYRNHSNLKCFIFNHLTEALRENWKDLIIGV